MGFAMVGFGAYSYEILELTHEQRLEALAIIRAALGPEFVFRDADPDDPRDLSDLRRIERGLSSARAQYEYTWKEAPPLADAINHLKEIERVARTLSEMISPPRVFPASAALWAADVLADDIQERTDPAYKCQANLLPTLQENLSAVGDAALAAVTRLQRDALTRRSRIQHIDALLSEVDDILKRHGQNTSFTTNPETNERSSRSVSIAFDLASTFLPIDMRPASWNAVMNRKVALSAKPPSDGGAD
jgi:hypothetical protein